MGKAENGEIREVTANIWEDRKHHLWFPISFTKYTVGNGRLYVNSGFLSSREDECLLYRITDITLYRSLPQRILEQERLSFTQRPFHPSYPSGEYCEVYAGKESAE